MARTKASQRASIVYTGLARQLKCVYKGPESGWARGIARLRHHKGIHHYLKMHPDKREQRNRWINQADKFGDATIVADTSVAENGGRGVYSLKSYEVGSYLPFVHAGVDMSFEVQEELCDYLAACTQQVEWSAEQVDEAVEKLATQWGVHLVERNGVRVPHWDTLYDTHVAYRCGTPDYMRIWNIFTWTGHLAAYTTTPSNAGLFINEPSHFKRFYNRVAEKNQLSVQNVMSVYEDGEIRYKVIRKIRRWDELLTYYGERQKRPYWKPPQSDTYKAPSINWERFIGMVHKIFTE